MKFNFSKIKKGNNLALYIVDVAMILLIVSNLLWVVFDSLFASEIIQSFLYKTLPDFSAFYAERIHSDFVSYDLIFVSIFIFEFSVRWVVAIYKKTYHSWFFYPFIHWYDLIGCIPVGSFRWLRLLRIISILYRLQLHGVIDLKETSVGRFFYKYLDVIVEEVSDRVVVNVLDGVQHEVKTGHPSTERVLTEVLLPNKSILANWLTAKINQISRELYHPNQKQVKDYINSAIEESLDNNERVSSLEAVPVIGPKIVGIVDSTVSDVVYNIVDKIITDIGNNETDYIVSEVLDDVLHRLLQPGDILGHASRDVIVEAIEVIKTEVQIKKWKQQEAL